MEVKEGKVTISLDDFRELEEAKDRREKEYNEKTKRFAEQKKQYEDGLVKIGIINYAEYSKAYYFTSKSDAVKLAVEESHAELKAENALLKKENAEIATMSFFQLLKWWLAN